MEPNKQQNIIQRYSLEALKDISKKLDNNEVQELLQHVADLLQILNTKENESLKPEFEKLAKAINAIDVRPQVTVTPQIETQEVDLAPVVEAIGGFADKLKSIQAIVPGMDEYLASIQQSVLSLQETLSQTQNVKLDPKQVEKMSYRGPTHVMDSNSRVINPATKESTERSITAFGELKVESKTPQVQLKFPYGQVLDLSQELTNNASSTVTYSGGNAIVTCAGAANAFSQIRSIDTIRYGPGQGSQFLGTCAFTTGVANSSQVFGPGDDDEGFFFGYNGTSFGVLRRSGGSLEIKTLTITGAADAGGGTFTITLDGDPVTITVGASATISQVVAAIVAAADDFLNAGRGWEVNTPDNVSIQFTSLVAENAAGSFSFADVDSGVTASAFSEPVAGVAPTENWVAQASWNIDPMDGTGPSGMTLDPTKGNVYQIKWQYLGYGQVVFSVENPVTGRFQDVHRIQYANNNTIPTLVNPTLHCTLIAKTETGYSGGALVMKTGSMAGFIEGKENPEGIRRSISVEKSMSTTENVLLILENDFVFKSLKNKVTVYPDFMSVGSESTKTTILRLYKMPTGITGGVALTDIQTNTSVMKYGSTGTTFTGGSQVLTMVFNNSGERDLGNINLKIRPGERYLLTGQLSSGAASLVNVSMTWVERI